METWATFSIIDHRRAVYQQALALFDRIVVPLPAQPIVDQTAEELDQLRAEIDYLQKENAAQAYDWKEEEWDKWRTPLLAESLAEGFRRDAYLDSRLMLAAHFSSGDVQAIPVYGGLNRFVDASMALQRELGHAEEALTVEIMQKLPVPDFDTPWRI